jgi:predicted DNA binding CopG/RHH family protein
MMSKIPKFTNEQEEAEFWATRDSTEFLDDTEAVDVTFVDSRPPKKQIALRLDGETIDALKAVASRKGIGYQTLIRLWVNERLEQEQIGALRS